MLEHLDKDLLMEIRHYDHEASVQLLNRVREASVTNQDIQRFSEVFLTTFGARIRSAKEPGIVRITEVPLDVRREGVKPSYEKATFEKEVAKQTRPEEVDFMAFGHPLFDATIAHCKAYELGFGGLTTAKVVEGSDHPGTYGLLCNFLLKFTDGRGQVVREELFPIFVASDGRLAPELLKQVLKVEKTALEPPPLTPRLQSLVPQGEALYQISLEAAKQKAKLIEDQVQDRREQTVRLLREDLERYASAKESLFQVRKAELLGKLEDLSRQLTLFPGEAQARIEGTIRLREYDLQQVELELETPKQRVQQRREELGNMEIVVAEAPKLLNLALVEFRA